MKKLKKVTTFMALSLTLLTSLYASDSVIYDFSVKPTDKVRSECKVKRKLKKSKLKFFISPLNGGLVKLHAWANICTSSRKQVNLAIDLAFPSEVLKTDYIASLNSDQVIEFPNIPSLLDNKIFTFEVKRLDNKVIILKGKKVENHVVEYKWFHNGELVHGPFTLFIAKDSDHLENDEAHLTPYMAIDIKEQIVFGPIRKNIHVEGLFRKFAPLE